MHAGAQDLVGFRNIGVIELRQTERGLHHTPAHMRPGLSTRFGSKLSLTRLVSAATPASCGSNTSTDARTAAGARTSVAWPPSRWIACRIAAPAWSDANGAIQISPPAQS